jgi:hypothetical protein
MSADSSTDLDLMPEHAVRIMLRPVASQIDLLRLALRSVR